MESEGGRSFSARSTLDTRPKTCELASLSSLLLGNDDELPENTDYNHPVVLKIYYLQPRPPISIEHWWLNPFSFAMR